MKPINKICLLIILVLVLAIILSFSVSIIKNQLHIRQLTEIGYYHLYTTYDARYEQYHVFIMIDAQTQNFEELKQWAQKIVTEEYIYSMNNSELHKNHGSHPTDVYLVSSSDELKFGWQKSDLNIEMNFDQSIFYRNSHIIVSIPMSARNFSDCAINSR